MRFFIRIVKHICSKYPVYVHVPTTFESIAVWDAA